VVGAVVGREVTTGELSERSVEVCSGPVDVGESKGVTGDCEDDVSTVSMPSVIGNSAMHAKNEITAHNSRQFVNSISLYLTKSLYD
jgi:hypothetical protein